MQTSHRFVLTLIAAIIILLPRSAILEAAARAKDLIQTFSGGQGGSSERPIAAIKLDQAASFARLSNRVLTNAPPRGSEFRSASRQTTRSRDSRFWTEKAKSLNPESTSACLGTGSGDMLELEPNDTVAQDVCLPVNIGGTISPFGD